MENQTKTNRKMITSAQMTAAINNDETPEQRIAKDVAKAMASATKMTESELIAFYTKKEAKRAKNDRKKGRKIAAQDAARVALKGVDSRFDDCHEMNLHYAKKNLPSSMRDI